MPHNPNEVPVRRLNEPNWRYRRRLNSWHNTKSRNAQRIARTDRVRKYGFDPTIAVVVIGIPVFAIWGFVHQALTRPSMVANPSYVASRTTPYALNTSAPFVARPISNATQAPAANVTTTPDATPTSSDTASTTTEQDSTGPTTQATNNPQDANAASSTTDDHFYPVGAHGDFTGPFQSAANGTITLSDEENGGTPEAFLYDGPALAVSPTQRIQVWYQVEAHDSSAIEHGRRANEIYAYDGHAWHILYSATQSASSR